MGPDAEVILDGGIMRGTDIAKALALGANGVGIGKVRARRRPPALSPFLCHNPTDSDTESTEPLLRSSSPQAYLYGLAAGGTPGVRKAIDIFKSELERAMGLLGVGSVEELRRRGPELVRSRPRRRGDEGRVG